MRGHVALDAWCSCRQQQIRTLGEIRQLERAVWGFQIDMLLHNLYKNSNSAQAKGFPAGETNHELNSRSTCRIFPLLQRRSTSSSDDRFRDSCGDGAIPTPSRTGHVLPAP